MQVRTSFIIVLLAVLFLSPHLVTGAEERECPRNEEYEKARSIAEVKEWRVLSLEHHYESGNAFWTKAVVESGVGGLRELIQVSRFRDVLETIVPGDVVKIELLTKIHLGDGMFNQDGKSGYFPAECVTREHVPIAGYRKVLRAGDYLLVTKRL